MALGACYRLEPCDVDIRRMACGGRYTISQALALDRQPNELIAGFTALIHLEIEGFPLAATENEGRRTTTYYLSRRRISLR